MLDPEHIHPRPGQLTPGWRRVAIIGWAFVVYGISAAAQAGDQLGKPPWWLDGPLVVVPFLLPVLAGVSAILNSRRSTLFGFAAVAGLAAVALADRTASPGVAAAEGIVALVGLLTTAAASAGRVPLAPSPAPSPAR